VTAYLARDLIPIGLPPVSLSFTVYANYTGGLHVG
jgi:hypothetical protein